MAGFSAEWLALREPADHRARNSKLQMEVVQYFAGVQHMRITDLGCGTGSNLRALAPLLGPDQQWQLVDYDPALLKAAADALMQWAPTAKMRVDGDLELLIEDRHVVVSFHQADLDRELDAVLDLPAQLVTAAAFFDLVSDHWIDRFTKACVTRFLPLYTVLTYDGRETWLPPHAADTDVLSAFHVHQQTDKGFGVAAGPRASDLLRTAFEQAGWQVSLASSPWLLGLNDADLIGALARGAAQAVGETGRVKPTTLESWLASRQFPDHCEVGHQDLFARP